MYRNRWKIRIINGLLALIVLSAAAYGLWPNKEVTRCGSIPSSFDKGKIVTSCRTCTCTWGIPSGFTEPECIGGKPVDCRP